VSQKALARYGEVKITKEVVAACWLLIKSMFFFAGVIFEAEHLSQGSNKLPRPGLKSGETRSTYGECCDHFLGQCHDHGWFENIHYFSFTVFFNIFTRHHTEQSRNSTGWSCGKLGWW